MDDQGNIFDLLGNFIGVANPDEIEEMQDYDQDFDNDNFDVNNLL